MPPRKKKEENFIILDDTYGETHAFTVATTKELNSALKNKEAKNIRVYELGRQLTVRKRFAIYIEEHD